MQSNLIDAFCSSAYKFVFSEDSKVSAGIHHHSSHGEDCKGQPKILISGKIDKMPFMLFSTTGMFSELFSLALQILVSSKPASSMKLPLIPLAGPL